MTVGQLEACTVFGLPAPRRDHRMPRRLEGASTTQCFAPLAHRHLAWVATDRVLAMRVFSNTSQGDVPGYCGLRADLGLSLGRKDVLDGSAEAAAFGRAGPLRPMYLAARKLRHGPPRWMPAALNGRVIASSSLPTNASMSDRLPRPRAEVFRKAGQ
ncbi:hypothetical protein [Salipiger mangrovisoli]|uniref:Uncharacterized protein n=1 Tax=Salipiger mangrovisoli TaxID=2865933 RepID=A0ABR9X983_9RHOB|nr:hypothetical protein [Salipiger mangrovisoli]MBE9640123.1 hypothetical protein [Salipiger mangrovisoli]